MAEATFDRAAFTSALATRRLGRPLIARARASSTNDLAWEGLAQGMADATVYVADHQERGRGREGRAWLAPPGAGLLISLGLRLSCAPQEVTLLPLVVGLAVARALERCGARPQLKWPNDLLLSGRKVAGVLCEARGSHGDRVAVMGVGVNVTQREEDFPPEIRGRATSLFLAGVRAGREVVAAEFLNALEPLLAEYQEGGGGERVRELYAARASFWGRPVTVRTGGDEVTGVARGLDSRGGLVVRLDSGREVVALAGDLELAGEET